MERHALTLTVSLAALGVFLSAVLEKSSAQTTVSSDVPQNGIVIAKLSRPVYPTVARLAHIAGEVELMLGIRQDGSIDSAVIIRGTPVLQRAALESAQQSQFECRGCSEAVTSYSLTYTFQLRDKGCCTAPDVHSDDVVQSQNHVTVVADVLCYCDSPADRRTRSAKCLYLWRCSTRQ